MSDNTNDTTTCERCGTATPNERLDVYGNAKCSGCGDTLGPPPHVPVPYDTTITQEQWDSAARSPATTASRIRLRGPGQTPDGEIPLQITYDDGATWQTAMVTEEAQQIVRDVVRTPASPQLDRARAAWNEAMVGHRATLQVSDDGENWRDVAVDGQAAVDELELFRLRRRRVEMDIGAQLVGEVDGEVHIGPIGSSPAAANFAAEMRRTQKEVLARAMSIPPEMLGAIDNSNRSTVEAAQAHLADRLTAAMSPLAMAIGNFAGAFEQATAPLRDALAGANAMMENAATQLARATMASGGALVPPEMADDFLAMLPDRTTTIDNTWTAADGGRFRARFGHAPAFGRCVVCCRDPRVRYAQETRVRRRSDNAPVHMLCENLMWSHRAERSWLDLVGAGEGESFVSWLRRRSDGIPLKITEAELDTNTGRCALELFDWNQRVTIGDARIYRKWRAAQERSRQAVRRAAFEARVRELECADTLPAPNVPSRSRALGGAWLTKPAAYVTAAGVEIAGRAMAEWRMAARAEAARENHVRRAELRPRPPAWIDGPLAPGAIFDAYQRVGGMVGTPTSDPVSPFARAGVAPSEWRAASDGDDDDVAGAPLGAPEEKCKRCGGSGVVGIVQGDEDYGASSERIVSSRECPACNGTGGVCPF